MPRLREEIMMHWLHSVIIPCTATQQIVLLPAEVMCDVHTVNDLSLPIWLHNFPRVISGVRQKEQSKCKANTQPPLHCPVYWPGQAEEGGERSKTGVWSPQTITTQHKTGVSSPQTITIQHKTGVLSSQTITNKHKTGVWSPQTNVTSVNWSVVNIFSSISLTFSG